MCDVKDCDEDYAFIVEGGHWLCDIHTKCTHCGNSMRNCTRV